MKKLTAILLAMLLALAGCGGNAAPAESEPAEIVVFAAASMQETLDEAIALYAQSAPGVTVTATYDSSGTLKTQIEEGAPCDLFISAAQKQMDQLDASAGAEKNPGGLDLVLENSRTDLLENKVVLVAPPENPLGLAGFEDMAAALSAGGCLMAMGNSDVPVGQYTSKILVYLGLDEQALADAGTITYGSNVKEVVTQVAEGLADFGVVYATDAFSSGKLAVLASADAEMCGQVIYPAAIIKSGSAPKAAQAFLDFLKTPEASAIFEGAGFTALN